jgi:glutamate-1-semialdehyde aminotransferase
MTTKHTPGPWGLGLGNDECQDICTEQGEHICTVAYYPIKENAALISAAPELLEALESLLEQVEALRWTGDIKEQAESKQCKQAHDAIRKAKGEG